MRLIPTTNLNFLKYRTIALGISTALFAFTVVLLFTMGLNFGIDFTGGKLIQIQTQNTPNIADLRASVGFENATIQEYGSPNEFLIRLPADLNIEAEHLQKNLADVAGEVQIRRVEFVGPQIGAELREKGLLAILFALGATLIYITMRFEFRYGVGAIAALCHDVFLTIGFFSLIQHEISLPVLAALLTVIGYSLNDTIVVFDRIRENRARFKKQKIENVINQSLNQTLNRTLMTSITTLIVLIALYFVGGSVIADFALTLLFGVVVGTYSSIFIASPILMMFEGYYQKLASEAEKGAQA